MAARKGGSDSARRDAPLDAEAAAQLEEFCRGLHPILLEADVSAFRRYLARWEEVVGSSADLSEETFEQTRQRMASMLRQPRLYGLPPWSAGAARVVAAQSNEVGVDWPDFEPPHSPLVARDQFEPVVSNVPPVATLPDQVVPAAFQVDMLTGEMIPVGRSSTAAPLRAEESPGKGPAAGPAPRKKRRMRRPAPDHLAQLTLWNDAPDVAG